MNIMVRVVELEAAKDADGNTVYRRISPLQVRHQLCTTPLAW